MPNSYFQFKKFRIEQGQCAMKVTTEGCILGAYANISKPKHILDIGTGTGLLSLMLAQRYEASIDAVEVEEQAFNQAKHNFQQSSWSNQISCHHSSIQSFGTNRKYDLIICNPPFFTDHLKSDIKEKNLAIHSDSLQQDQLVLHINRLLADEGTAFVLYPEYESESFLTVAQKTGLYLSSILKIYNQPNKHVFRCILTLNKKSSSVSNDQLIIREGSDYTNDFKALLKEYYLHL